MKSIISICIFIIISAYCYTQSIPADSLYLGQTPPGNTPKIFELPVSAGCRAQERISITPDNKQVYYTEIEGWDIASAKRIKYLSYYDNKWNGPFILFEDYWNPVLSPSGDTMYFLKGNNQNMKFNNPEAWYSVKSDTGWSNPAIFWYHKCSKVSLQRTNMGSYYFTTVIDTQSGDGIISKLIINNEDTLIQSLGSPINSTNNGAFYISRDE